MTKALTVTRIDNAKATDSRQEIPDGLLPGLYLVVQPKPSGAKSFAVRYRYAGQTRKLTLGAYPALKLEAARDIGGTALRAAAAGRDPATEKQTAKVEAKRQAAEIERGKRDLFENVVLEFLERHAMQSTRESSWRETARILGFKFQALPEGHSYPRGPRLIKGDDRIRQVVPGGELIEAGGDVLKIWKGWKIQEIVKRDVISLLDSVNDRGSPIMANRVLSAVRKLFNWCAARDVIPTSPCALVDPPAPERSRDRVLTDDELRLVWNAADGDGWPFGPLIKLLMLTGQRLSEVGGMRWDEVDLEGKLWTLPAERVKNGQRHEVPLSDAAVAIIKNLPRIKTSKGYVFATRRDAAVSGFSRAKDRLDASIAIAGADAPVEPWVFHDLRRTMASGMARLGIQLPVIEKVLNHTSGSFRGIVSVYQRHSFAEEKRAALAAWASHVNMVVTGKRPANVVQMRAQQ